MACASFGLKCPQCSRTFEDSVPSLTEWTTDSEWALQHRVHKHTTWAKSHTEVRMKDLKNVAIAVWLCDADGESTQVPYPEPKQPAAEPASQASRPASSSAPAPAPASASGGEPTTPWAKLEERIEVVLGWAEQRVANSGSGFTEAAEQPNSGWGEEGRARAAAAFRSHLALIASKEAAERRSGGRRGLASFLCSCYYRHAAATRRL